MVPQTEGALRFLRAWRRAHSTWWYFHSVEYGSRRPPSPAARDGETFVRKNRGGQEDEKKIIAFLLRAEDGLTFILEDGKLLGKPLDPSKDVDWVPLIPRKRLVRLWEKVGVHYMTLASVN